MLVKEERSPEEVKASKVTDAQIKRYWRDRENERKAPRVHQETLSVEEKVLRYWDMSSQYGVSTLHSKLLQTPLFYLGGSLVAWKADLFGVASDRYCTYEALGQSK